MKARTGIWVVALLASLALVFGPAQAAEVTWDGGGGDDDLSTDANWNPDGAPTLTDSGSPETLVITGTDSKADETLNNDLGTIYLDGVRNEDFSMPNLQGGTIQFSSGALIKQNDNHSNTQLTISSAMVLNGAMTVEFGVNKSKAIVLAGDISGSYDITLDETGTSGSDVVFTGTNTFNNLTSVDTNLQIGLTASYPTGVVAVGGNKLTTVGVTADGSNVTFSDGAVLDVLEQDADSNPTTAFTFSADYTTKFNGLLGSGGTIAASGGTRTLNVGGNLDESSNPVTAVIERGTIDSTITLNLLGDVIFQNGMTNFANPLTVDGKIVASSAVTITLPSGASAKGLTIFNGDNDLADGTLITMQRQTLRVTNTDALDQADITLAPDDKFDCTLDLDVGAISDSADVVIDMRDDGKGNLSYGIVEIAEGVIDTVGSLTIEGDAKAAGTYWGSTDAQTANPGKTVNVDDNHFDGTGLLYVVPEPATMVLLGLGGVGLLIRRRRK